MDFTIFPIQSWQGTSFLSKQGIKYGGFILVDRAPGAQPSVLIMPLRNSPRNNIITLCLYIVTYALDGGHAKWSHKEIRKHMIFSRCWNLTCLALSGVLINGRRNWLSIDWNLTCLALSGVLINKRRNWLSMDWRDRNLLRLECLVIFVGGWNRSGGIYSYYILNLAWAVFQWFIALVFSIKIIIFDVLDQLWI